MLLGQGTGGGALALVPADRVRRRPARAGCRRCRRRARSAIVHRDVDARRRRWLRRRASARSTCSRDGIVDRIVHERPDAADEPEEFCRRLGQVLQPSSAGCSAPPAVSAGRPGSPLPAARRLTGGREGGGGRGGGRGGGGGGGKGGGGGIAVMRRRGGGGGGGGRGAAGGGGGCGSPGSRARRPPQRCRGHGLHDEAVLRADGVDRGVPDRGAEGDAEGEGGRRPGQALGERGPRDP